MTCRCVGVERGFFRASGEERRGVDVVLGLSGLGAGLSGLGAGLLVTVGVVKVWIVSLCSKMKLQA